MKDEDADALKAAITLVKEREPRAVRMLLETSDQDYYGFVLNDLVLGPDGTLLSEVDDDRRDEIAEDVWEHICNLSWNGVVGEDRGGRADIALSEDGS